MRHEFEKKLLEKKEMDLLLAKMRVGHLATVDSDGSPYIVPLDYRYVDGVIYFHGATKGQKIENIRINPKVSFEVTSIDPAESRLRSYGSAVGRRWECVVIRGRAEHVTDQAERTKAFPKSSKGVYKIKPELITGRSTFRKT